MKKELTLILLLLLGGLYVMGFGIMTMVKFRELYINGLILLCFGISVVMFSIVGLIEIKKD